MQDLDLRRPGVRKPARNITFDVTTDEVLRKADFRVSLSEFSITICFPSLNRRALLFCKWCNVRQVRKKRAGEFDIFIIPFFQNLDGSDVISSLLLAEVALMTWLFTYDSKLLVTTYEMQVQSFINLFFSKFSAIVFFCILFEAVCTSLLLQLSAFTYDYT